MAAVTAAVVGAAAAVGGIVQSRKASRQQERALKRQGRAQAEQAEIDREISLKNAEELERQAEIEEQVTRSEVADVFRMTQRLIGEQQAGFAAAGVQQGAGTTQDVLIDTLAEAELEAAKIRAGGEEIVRNLEARAEVERLGGESSALSATLSRTTAGAAASAARIQGQAQVLGGISNLALQTPGLIRTIRGGGGTTLSPIDTSSFPSRIPTGG